MTCAPCVTCRLIMLPSLRCRPSLPPHDRGRPRRRRAARCSPRSARACIPGRTARSPGSAFRRRPTAASRTRRASASRCVTEIAVREGQAVVDDGHDGDPLVLPTRRADFGSGCQIGSRRPGLRVGHASPYPRPERRRGSGIFSTDLATCSGPGASMVPQRGWYVALAPMTRCRKALYRQLDAVRDLCERVS